MIEVYSGELPRRHNAGVVELSAFVDKYVFKIFNNTELVKARFGTEIKWLYHYFKGTGKKRRDAFCEVINGRGVISLIGIDGSGFGLKGLTRRRDLERTMMERYKGFFDSDSDFSI